jgi:hypothetical protein
MDMVAMPPWILFQGVITVVVAITTITTLTKSIVLQIRSYWCRPLLPLHGG